VHFYFHRGNSLLSKQSDSPPLSEKFIEGRLQESPTEVLQSTWLSVENVDIRGFGMGKVGRVVIRGFGMGKQTSLSLSCSTASSEVTSAFQKGLQTPLKSKTTKIFDLFLDRLSPERRSCLALICVYFQVDFFHPQQILAPSY
jgi:hypothetical protein